MTTRFHSLLEKKIEENPGWTVADIVDRVYLEGVPDALDPEIRAADRTARAALLRLLALGRIVKRRDADNKVVYYAFGSREANTPVEGPKL